MISNTIFIIRHGDKPDTDGVAPFGVEDDGSQDFESLLVKGWQRAGCWRCYFLPTAGGGPLNPTSAHVFAADLEKHGQKGDGSKSRRPVETVTPLAALLPQGVPDVTYTKGQEHKVAEAAAARPEEATVICWQHEDVPRIIDKLIPGWAAAHGAWAGSCFNGIVTLARSGGGWQFAQAAPVLLAGDTSAAPFADA